MKSIKVTLNFQVSKHVTIEFIEKYFEKMMIEKVHNPVAVLVEEVESDFNQEKL